MKKNGFTLIEVLVVIVLLAAISVTVGVSMGDISQRNKEKEIDNYKSKIEDAACLYAELKNITATTTIYVSNLLDEGYLRKDMVNPESKKPITDEKDKEVIITFNDNEKKCEFERKD